MFNYIINSLIEILNQNGYTNLVVSKTLIKQSLMTMRKDYIQR